jgi:hypothetical protein
MEGKKKPHWAAKTTTGARTDVGTVPRVQGFIPIRNGLQPLITVTISKRPTRNPGSISSIQNQLDTAGRLDIDPLGSAAGLSIVEEPQPPGHREVGS